MIGVGFACVLALAAACGGGSDAGPLIPGTACIPGQQIACTCPGGEVGAQACTSNGEGYGTCAGCGVSGPLPGLDATVSNNDGAGPTQGDDDSGQTTGGDDSGQVTGDDSGQTTGDDGGHGGDDGGGSGNDAGGSHDSGNELDAGEPDAAKPHDASIDATKPEDSGSNPPVDAGPCDPAAFDFTNKCGTTASCDQSLAAGGPASDFAKAIGICPVSVDATHWGLVSATYSSGHSYQDAGAANFEQQHGILPAFGSVLLPREGSMMGVLSSGSATATDTDTGPFFKGGKAGMQGVGGVLGTTGNSGDLPPGFPQTYPGCPAVSTVVNDLIDVRLQIRVPTNATGMAFDFNFMSSDWPDYVCSSFNDGFIAYLSSGAFNGGTPANMAKDANGNPVTINAPTLPVCTAGTQLACASGAGDAGAPTSTCVSGPTSLNGTGYAEDTAGDAGSVYCGTTPSTSGGSTNWVTSTATVLPGEVITLELIIWDSQDSSYDSSVLLDHLHWLH